MKIEVKKPSFNKLEVNVKKYQNNPNEMIQLAIDEVSSLGGGYVIIPAGIYISKPIYLKSNVCIKTKAGALVIFPKKKEWYKLQITEYEGVKRIRTISPINARNVNNIGIIGEGIFDGDGFSWRPLKSFKVPEKQFKKCLEKSNTFIPTKEGGIWYPSESSYELAINGDEPAPTEENLLKYAKNYDYFRPVMVSIVNCDKVILSGVTFKNSPAWNIHPLYTKNLTIKNCFIQNDFSAQNGDGIDIESCENVLIKGNKLAVGDDGICIKSGKNKEARLIKIPTKNVLIEDNLVLNAHGGIVIGSEMSRGVYDVYANNNTFIGTDIGLRFKTQLGRGGVVEKIYIKNTRMYDIKEEAIILTTGYELYRMENESRDIVKEIAEDDIPEFRNIYIENLDCLNAKKPIVIKGLPERKINHIYFKNLNIEAKEESNLTNYEDVYFTNCNIRVE